jgi:cytochrome c oxidase cbb3-type subunit I/II
MTTSKEYAELEWPIDIAITIIWVVFGWNMIGTIIKRRERHMYVAIWFYIATFITVAVLHLVNSFEMPVTLFKSYSWYAGVQDALVQWWYGHNAVAFFLTTPFLGLMYYFLPKAANRPVYSYRPFNHSLLVFDFHLYLGWTPSPFIHFPSRLGTIAWRGLFHHADLHLPGAGC